MARLLRTERGLDRLVNFSDATVAIAITLLLLPLVDIATEIEHRSLSELFLHDLDTFIAFGVSFAVIARLWLSHHRLFESTRSYSPGMLRMNFLWLASIAFLPFASNLIAHAPRDRGVNALYIGTITVTSLCMLVMEQMVLRNPEILTADGAGDLHPIDSRLAFAALLLALVVAVSLPDVGLYALFLLIPAGRIAAVLERRRGSRTGPTAP